MGVQVTNHSPVLKDFCKLLIWLDLTFIFSQFVCRKEIIGPWNHSVLRVRLPSSAFKLTFLLTECEYYSVGCDTYYVFLNS
jgi:hypothetical protein